MTSRGRRGSVNEGTRLVFRAHAVRRMFGRGVTLADVREVVENGEVIQRRPDDLPCPGRLILGRAGERPLHVVVADDLPGGAAIVATVYEPDPALKAPGFRKRRQR